MIDKINYILNSYFLVLWGIICYEFGYFDKFWKWVRLICKVLIKMLVKIIKCIIDIVGVLVFFIFVWLICLIIVVVIKFILKGLVIFK